MTRSPAVCVLTTDLFLFHRLTQRNWIAWSRSMFLHIQTGQRSFRSWSTSCMYTMNVWETLPRPRCYKAWAAVWTSSASAPMLITRKRPSWVSQSKYAGGSLWRLNCLLQIIIVTVLYGLKMCFFLYCIFILRGVMAFLLLHGETWSLFPSSLLVCLGHWMMVCTKSLCLWLSATVFLCGRSTWLTLSSSLQIAGTCTHLHIHTHTNTNTVTCALPEHF